MNSRERWTVYPLLFLSLGMGLRSRITGLEDVKAVQCQSLTITGHDGNPTVRLRSTADGKSGIVEVCGADGMTLATLGSNQLGGNMIARRADRKWELEVGYEEIGPVVLAVDHDSKQTILVPWATLSAIRKTSNKEAGEEISEPAPQSESSPPQPE